MIAALTTARVFARFMARIVHRSADVGNAVARPPRKYCLLDVAFATNAAVLQSRA
jgi:hypothetical protein